MSDLLIIECDYYLRGDKYADTYENLVNQKAMGTVLLLPGMRAKLVPEDVDIQLKTPYKKEPEVIYKWIPCSERLPEEDGIYLVTVNFLNDRPTFADFMNGRWITHMDDNVLAWMPLPDIYKGE